MGRYTGFFAFGLLIVAAAVYSFLPADGNGEAVRPPQPRIEAASPPAKPMAPVSRLPLGSGFDFYVLALSWSPTFCDSEAAGRNRDQCGEDKRFGWVVHGLWPQNEQGYPESCASGEGNRVPERVGRTMMDIMPGMGLIGHQWRKHGTCSGLSMADYFDVVRAAYDRIQIPSELDDVSREASSSPQAVEAAFIRSNPGLTRSAVAVTCDSQRIDEVRICLTPSLDFRTCPEVDRRSCRRSDIVIPPLP